MGQLCACPVSPGLAWMGEQAEQVRDNRQGAGEGQSEAQSDTVTVRLRAGACIEGSDPAVWRLVAPTPICVLPACACHL